MHVVTGMMAGAVLRSRKNTVRNGLEIGYSFPRTTCKLDREAVTLYFKAVQEEGWLYKAESLVPPLAVAGLAMAVLLEPLQLPPGVIHTHAEIDFSGIARIGDIISCSGSISQRLDRGVLQLVTVDIDVLDQNRKRVLKGKVSFILPPSEDENR